MNGNTPFDILYKNLIKTLTIIGFIRDGYNTKIRYYTDNIMNYHDFYYDKSCSILYENKKLVAFGVEDITEYINDKFRYQIRKNKILKLFEKVN